jgi:Methyltransferase domain
MDFMKIDYNHERNVMIPCDTYPFKIFETNPKAYKVFLSYLQSVPDEVSALINDCINKFISQGISKIKWLDVGAGLGDPVFPVLKLLERQGITVEYSYLDPSLKAFNIFSNFAKTNHHEHLVKDVNITTWENYSTSNSYDLITFFHSAYYIKNWFSNPSSLSKAVSLLNPRGFVFFSNLDKMADYNRIVSIIENEGNRRPPITSEDILSRCSYLSLTRITTRSFHKYLPISYIKSSNHLDYMDIVEFLSDRPFTSKSSDLVSGMSDNMLFPISTIAIESEEIMQYQNQVS